MLKRLGWIALALPAVAFAGGVDLDVGETKDIDVGAARGLVCDDLSIVSVDIRTDQDDKRNKVVLKGLKVGTTTCRAGNIALGTPVRIFEVSVHLPKQ